MGHRFIEGEHFYLPENVFVMVGNYNVESGRLYEKGRDRSNTRAALTDTISQILDNDEAKYDPDIVRRFVNYIAKDIEPNSYRLCPGEFVVTKIELSGANDEKVFCHRVGDPTDRMYFAQNRTYGHYRLKPLSSDNTSAAQT